MPTLYGLGECQSSLSGLGPSGPEEELDCVLFLAGKPRAGPQIQLSTPGSREWPRGDENHRSVHLLSHAPSVSLGPGSGFWMETDPGKGDKLKVEFLMGKAIWQEGRTKSLTYWGCPLQSYTGGWAKRDRGKEGRLQNCLCHMDRGSGGLSQPPASRCPHMDACAHVGPQIGSPGDSESQNQLL